MKLNAAVLKKKYGPLPVWAWAIMFAGIIFLLWRHARNNAGSSNTTPVSAGTTPANAPGDMSSNAPDNSGNLDTTPTDVSAGGLGGDILPSDLGASSLDNSQGDGSNSNPVGTNSAPPGLTHIFGDYWWDEQSGQLVKIPGSGGANKGSGKKKNPKNKNNKGGHSNKKPAKKTFGWSLARTHIHAARNPAKNRSSRSPGTDFKPRILPLRRGVTNTQYRAVNRTNHPRGEPQPIHKSPARSRQRVLPSRPRNITRRPR